MCSCVSDHSLTTESPVMPCSICKIRKWLFVFIMQSSNCFTTPNVPGKPSYYSILSLCTVQENFECAQTAHREYKFHNEAHWLFPPSTDTSWHLRNTGSIQRRNISTQFFQPMHKWESSWSWCWMLTQWHQQSQRFVRPMPAPASNSATLWTMSLFSIESNFPPLSPQWVGRLVVRARKPLPEVIIGMSRCYSSQDKPGKITAGQ